MTICVFRKYEKNMETLKHGNMLENLIIKDNSENTDSYRVPSFTAPVPPPSSSLFTVKKKLLFHHQHS